MAFTKDCQFGVYMDNEVFDLTFTQQEIYLDQIRNEKYPLYNVGGYIKFRQIDLSRLRYAHWRLISDLEIFGMRIGLSDGKIKQRFDSKRNAELELIDFSSQGKSNGGADDWLSALFEKPIQVDNSCLYKAYILKISDFEFRYVGLAHHILMDGIGFANWAKLICALYENPEVHIPQQFSLCEKVAEESGYTDSRRYQVDRDFWMSELSRAICAPIYPRHRNSLPAQLYGKSGQKILEFARPEMERARSVAAELGVGVAHLLLAVLALQFSRGVSRKQLIIGVPSHNRRGAKQKASVGAFVSMTPLYVDLADGDMSLEDVIYSISSAQLRSLRHQRYPIAEIVKCCPAMLGRQPLYDVGFNYLKLGSDIYADNEMVNLVYLGHGYEQLPLMVTVCEYGDTDRIALQFDYNLAYFNGVEAELIANRFKYLMDSLSVELRFRIDDLVGLPKGEVGILLKGFGDDELSGLPATCIHQLFEVQARATPQAIAVESGGFKCTYRELDEFADQFAGFLLSRGIKNGSLVGLSVGRHASMIAAILGILKLGAAYVPLDPAYPEKRIRDIVTDSRLSCILTEGHFSRYFNGLGLELLTLEDAKDFKGAGHDKKFECPTYLSPESIAYVIYTSGSTGRPKGVQICHASVAALIHWASNTFSTQERRRVLFSTSINFDLSIFEIFAPLLSGGSCIIVENILQLLGGGISVSMINTVPSAVRMLLDQNSVPAGVDVINLAGEQLPGKTVNDLLEKKLCIRVFNLYGPTEDTTYSSYAIFDAPISGVPPIGRAIAGTRFFVLDDRARILPWGAVGELYICGLGLAKGYLNNPGLTCEKFVEGEGDGLRGLRLYRTGDLVRYDCSGSLEYLGRNDEQVKIRGFRIELGEIQRCLESGTEVDSSAIVVRQFQDEHFLAAFVVRSKASTTATPRWSDDIWLRELRNLLDRSLPKYMIPSFLMVLERLPLTTNGKVDKLALMDLELVQSNGVEPIAPDSDTERELVRLVAALLDRDPEKIGVMESLFELGAHSLMLIRLASRVDLELGVTLPIGEYFQASHIRDIARRLDDQAVFQSITEMAHRAELLGGGYL